MSNEKIKVYSNKLGFFIDSFDLNDLNGSKDNRDKLLDKLLGLIIKHPDLHCLLLSLLDKTCLHELIENPPNSPNQSNENSPNLLNIFYCYETHNYRFIHYTHQIKVEKFKLKERLKANNCEHEQLKFSDISHDDLGNYRLEKGSMIWKFKFEESQIMKASIVDIKEDLMGQLSEHIDKLAVAEGVGVVNDQINGFERKLHENKYYLYLHLHLEDYEENSLTKEIFNEWKSKIENIENQTIKKMLKIKSNH